MNMLKSLLKIRLLSLWQAIVGSRVKRGKSKGKGKLVLYALLAIYIVGALFASVGLMFMQIAEALVSFGLGWLAMGIAALMCVVISVVGSIFTTQQQIYEAKDNELLLSMPIPPSYILATRILMVLLLNMLFGVFILVPAFFVYCMALPAVSPLTIVNFILAFVLISFISTALSCIGGGIVAFITSKIRRKNLVSTVLMLALFFAYMYFYMNLQKYTAKLIATGAEIAVAISKSLPPIYYFGRAIDGPDLTALLMFALWCLVPFAVVYFLLSKSFIKIATTKRGTVRVKYREKELKVSSVRSALIKKELSRFFSLPLYVFNCSLGAVFALVGAVALIIKGGELKAMLAMVPELTPYVPLLVCATICFMATTNCITAPSISLEARTLWLLKSMPVSAYEVFYAKIMASLIVTLPPLAILSVVACAVLGATPLEWLLIILTPLLLQVFISLMGLVLNLLLPRFDWLSEMVVIKQSGSVVAAVFGGMGVALLPALIYLLFAHNIPGDIYMAMCALLFLILSLIMLAFLKGKGARIFNNL